MKHYKIEVLEDGKRTFCFYMKATSEESAKAYVQGYSALLKVEFVSAQEITQEEFFKAVYQPILGV